MVILELSDKALDFNLYNFVLYLDYKITMLCLNGRLDKEYTGEHHIYTKEEFDNLDLQKNMPYYPYKTKREEWDLKFKEDIYKKYKCLN